MTRPHRKTFRRALASVGLTVTAFLALCAYSPAFAGAPLAENTLQLAQGAPAATNAPAAPAAPPKKTQLYDPLGNVSVTTLVARATMGFMGLSGTAALVFFIYGGFQMITAAGNEKKYSSGMNSLKWAVIGLFVIFGSYALLNALFSALGSAAS